MELYIFDSELNFLGILETFNSLRKVIRYYSNGFFELQCYLTPVTLELLSRENIVYTKGDNKAFYIETVIKLITEDGQELITASGKDLTGYLERRINWGRTNFKGTTENLMRKLVLENVISPTDKKRNIPYLVLGDLKGFAENIIYQNSFGNLLEQLQIVANANNLGFHNLLDIKHKNIIFDVYKGVDRTVNNGSNAPCIFSRNFENILGQDYYDSVNNYKNTCLIAGTGEGEKRILTSIENGEGINRYELYVDARDITNVKKDPNGEDVTIQTEEYENILKQRGYEKFSEYREVQTFNSIINVNGNNKYKKDFDLGDLVTVIDKKWRVQADVRITEIEEIYEESGLKINAVFGNPVPTLIDKLRQQIK